MSRLDEMATLPWNTEVSNSSLRVPEDVEIVMLILDGPSKRLASSTNFGCASKSQTGGILLEGPTQAFIYLGVKQLSLSYPLEIVTGTHARSDDVHTWEKYTGKSMFTCPDAVNKCK